MSVLARLRPVSLSLLVLGLVVQGLSGLYGGGALVMDPTGSRLQLPLSLLDDAPFSDYLVPGLLLLTVLRLGPLVVAFGLWTRAIRERWVGRRTLALLPLAALLLHGPVLVGLLYLAGRLGPLL
jgi:hypothetical protein